MDWKQLRIVFMGTPDFAVASLDALVKNGCHIVAVITAPDKPAGRGLQLTTSAVKNYALAQDLPILQPEKLKNPEFLESLRALKADLQIVVAFRMLPEIVWNMPPMGTVNLHGSLLPQYRGAAPIHWAVINGEKQTGVTTFKLKQEIDTGEILLQKSFSIGDEETTGEVHDRMKIIGAELLMETVKQLADNGLHPIDQSALLSSNTILHHAPKIFTETCIIHWEDTVEKIGNLIRGLDPFPGAISYLNGKLLKIFKCQKEISHHKYPAGKVISDGKTFFKIACSNGYIQLLDIQLAGKKRMPIPDFLRGYPVAADVSLQNMP
jgi:methionyl-tRNA formyltransferase